MNNLPSKQKHSLIRLGAASLFGMALCYIVLFIIYGAVLAAPNGSEIEDRIAHLIEHATLIKVTYIVGYMLFACLLCLSVQAVHKVFSGKSPTLINTASLFGFFWVVVLLCSGMIGITSVELIAKMDASDPSASATFYRASVLLVESLGGGIEFIGGVWILLLGIAGWINKLFSKAFAIFSMAKGVIGIATLFSIEPILRDLFGLTGIVWFVWLGAIILKSSKK